jgi:hypothetical protein
MPFTPPGRKVFNTRLLVLLVETDLIHEINLETEDELSSAVDVLEAIPAKSDVYAERPKANQNDIFVSLTSPTASPVMYSFHKLLHTVLLCKLRDAHLFRLPNPDQKCFLKKQISAFSPCSAQSSPVSHYTIHIKQALSLDLKSKELADLLTATRLYYSTNHLTRTHAIAHARPLPSLLSPLPTTLPTPSTPTRLSPQALTYLSQRDTTTAQRLSSMDTTTIEALATLSLKCNEKKSLLLSTTPPQPQQSVPESISDTDPYGFQTQMTYSRRLEILNSRINEAAPAVFDPPRHVDPPTRTTDRPTSLTSVHAEPPPPHPIVTQLKNLELHIILMHQIPPIQTPWKEPHLFHLNPQHHAVLHAHFSDHHFHIIETEDTRHPTHHTCECHPDTMFLNRFLKVDTLVECTPSALVEHIRRLSLEILSIPYVLGQLTTTLPILQNVAHIYDDLPPLSQRYSSHLRKDIQLIINHCHSDN